MFNLTKKTVYLIGFIFLASLSRLIPHPWNFTAVGALALLGGREFKNLGFALALPILSMFIGDIFLGFHSSMFFTYSAMAIIGLIAWSLKETVHGIKLPLWSLFSSLTFYFISNFGVWQSGELYNPDWQGFVTCMVMGIPFLKGQIFGDIFFTLTVFSVWKLASSNLVAKTPVQTNR